jgi:hypothetical protein
MRASLFTFIQNKEKKQKTKKQKTKKQKTKNKKQPVPRADKKNPGGLSNIPPYT